jgi:hypothetical protein
VTDPAVREGHSFGFSRRSELVEFFGVATADPSRTAGCDVSGLNSIGRSHIMEKLGTLQRSATKFEQASIEAL